MSQPISVSLFSFRGRLSRENFNYTIIILATCFTLSVVPAILLLFWSLDWGASLWLVRAEAIGVAVLFGIWAYIAASLQIRRLHDRGFSAWMWLLTFVPYVNLWLLFVLTFFRSKPAANRYGEPPLAIECGKAWPVAIGIVALLVAVSLPSLAIRSLAIQPFNIPATSMEPTLLVGDYFFVSKSAYGYSRYSFPFGIVPISGRIFAAEPQLGDLIVFKFPADNQTDYVKRIVGLPGDRVQMKEGVLYINEQPLPQTRIEDFVGLNPCPFSSDKGVRPGESIVHVPRLIETLPNGIRYEILDCNSSGPLDNTQAFVVPAGHYFTMGDNRDNSADSRVDVGNVPFENLVGRAQMIFFSHDGSARLWDLAHWPSAIRYDRIGQLTR